MSDLIQIMEISMLNDMRRLNVVSNNLANVNTAGFKKGITVQNAFEKAFVSEENLSEKISGMSTSIKNRRFTEGVQSITDLSAGSVKYTGNPLHLMVGGDGMFEIMTRSGIAYTKNGNFMKDATGKLVTTDGYALQGLGGDIRLLSDSPRIDSQGNVWEGKNQIAQIKTVRLKTSQTLKSIGNGLYKATGLLPENSENQQVKQGYLENSNVSSMNEMVNLIEVMRHFETSQKVVSSYDSIMDTAIRTLGEF